MQTVDWDDDNLPPIFVSLDDPAICFFFDRPDEHAFEVGDQIRHFSEIGPSVYRVISVRPERDPDSDYYSDMTSVYSRVHIRPVEAYDAVRRVERRDNTSNDVPGR